MRFCTALVHSSDGINDDIIFISSTLLPEIGKYKTGSQMAPIVLFPYLDEQDKTLWLALSKVIIVHTYIMYGLLMIYCTYLCLDCILKLLQFIDVR